MRKRAAMISLVSVLTLVALAACSTPQPTANSAAAPVTVTVDAGDFYIKSSLTAFKVGVPYHFALHNSGSVAHEVMLMPMVKADRGMSMSDMDKMALGMVEQKNFGAGADGSFDVTFAKAYAPGELEFACHMPGHYEAGMKLPITVTSD